MPTPAKVRIAGRSLGHIHQPAFSAIGRSRRPSPLLELGSRIPPARPETMIDQELGHTPVPDIDNS